jgi:hypothetical protein
MVQQILLGRPDHFGRTSPAASSQTRSRTALGWQAPVSVVCTQCGMIGADVRPDWGPHVNKRHI